MAIVISIQYKGGFLPDTIILWTPCYYHGGSQLYPMESFCSYSLCSHLNVLAISPPNKMDSQKVCRGVDAFRFVFKLQPNVPTN